MKKRLKDKINKELDERIKKEVDEKYNEYLNEYSCGFSEEELKRELYITKEEIMVINCEVDVLESGIKKPKEVNYYFVFGAIIGNSLINLILNNNLVSLISIALNIMFIAWSLKRIKAFNRLKNKRDEIFKLQKEALYLELKMLVLDSILMDHI